MTPSHFSALVVTVALASALAGCTGEDRHDFDSSSTLLENSIACNLGEQYDQATASVRARYLPPVDADYYREHYGEWVANESCSDSQVLAWQELRRAAGESDEICRVVYEYSVAGLVYPIGCAAPVMVVTDASR